MRYDKSDTSTCTPWPLPNITDTLITQPLTPSALSWHPQHSGYTLTVVPLMRGDEGGNQEWYNSGLLASRASPPNELRCLFVQHVHCTSTPNAHVTPRATCKRNRTCLFRSPSMRSIQLIFTCSMSFWIKMTSSLWPGLLKTYVYMYMYIANPQLVTTNHREWEREVHHMLTYGICNTASHTQIANKKTLA